MCSVSRSLVFMKKSRKKVCMFWAAQYLIQRFGNTKGLSTREAGRGHTTPHMLVETEKCWWLLKIEPNAWAGGKGSLR